MMQWASSLASLFGTHMMCFEIMPIWKELNVLNLDVGRCINVTFDFENHLRYEMEFKLNIAKWYIENDREK